MTQKWKKALSAPNDNIAKVLKTIDSSGMGISFVLNKKKQLIGTVTDGDIRRAIIKKNRLDTQIKKIMNKNFISASVKDINDKILQKMSLHDISQIPVLNQKKEISNVLVLSQIAEKKAINNTVIIMAGGFGKRLFPLTKNTPKPMLKVKGVPILEKIILSLKNQGFQNFVLSVFYKSEMIQNHFGDGSRFNISISYIRENNPLGTAGSLGLIKKFKNTEPILVINGDILTHLDYLELVKSHYHSNSSATICVRSSSYKIPFGVVKVKENKLINIIEKPTETYLINAGIYIFEQKLLKHIPAEKSTDMPDFITKLIKLNKKINVFSIYEDWIDLGRIEDFKSLN